MEAKLLVRQDDAVALIDGQNAIDRRLRLRLKECSLKQECVRRSFQSRRLQFQPLLSTFTNSDVPSNCRGPGDSSRCVLDRRNGQRDLSEKPSLRDLLVSRQQEDIPSFFF